MESLYYLTLTSFLFLLNLFFLKNVGILPKIIDKTKDKFKELDGDKVSELKMLEDDKKHLEELYEYKKKMKTLNDDIKDLKFKISNVEYYEKDIPYIKTPTLNEIKTRNNYYLDSVMLQQERKRMLHRLSNRDGFNVQIKAINDEFCMIHITNKDINFIAYYTLESFSFGLIFTNHIRRSLRNVFYETPTEFKIIELERKVINDIRNHLLLID